jgi:hypothetical protein
MKSSRESVARTPRTARSTMPSKAGCAAGFHELWFNEASLSPRKIRYRHLSKKNVENLDI